MAGGDVSRLVVAFVRVTANRTYFVLLVCRHDVDERAFQHLIMLFVVHGLGAIAREVSEKLVVELILNAEII